MSDAPEGDDEPSRPFSGTVRRGRTMEPGVTVLVLERYEGDVEVGETIVVAVGTDEARAQIVQIAWGSSFGHEAPPLTLLVRGLDDGGEYAGAALRSDGA